MFSIIAKKKQKKTSFAEKTIRLKQYLKYSLISTEIAVANEAKDIFKEARKLVRQGVLKCDKLSRLGVCHTISAPMDAFWHVLC